MASIGGLTVNQDSRYKQPSGNGASGGGVGGAVGRFIGFDPTPGFNISNPLNGASSTSKPQSGSKPKVLGEHIDDNNPLAPTGGGGTNGYDPGSVATIGAGIQSANNGLGLLDRQQDIGLQDVNSSYQGSLNKLLQGFGQAQRNYDTTKTQSTQDNVNARNDIQAGVGRNANALQRLLGQHGAGNSSAAQIVAPYGAALQGTQQLRGVSDAYGRNMQSLDTNWQDYNSNFNNSREDLDRQKYTQENSLRGDVAGRRQQLLSSLAQLTAQQRAAQGGSSAAALAAAQPYLSQANNAASQQVDYGRQYASPIQAQTVNYAAPDLQQYNYDQGQGPTADNTSAYTDTISPALSSLLGLGKRRDANQAY